MRASLVGLIAGSLLLVACGDKGSDSKTSNTTPAAGTPAGAPGPKGAVGADVAKAKADAKTVNGRCPVQTGKLVEPEDTLTYKDPVTGKDLLVGFCCGKCPTEFKKDPEKYMKVMRDDPTKFGYAP
jgi:hypothetical protein